MAESNFDKAIRSSAIMGRRGRGSRKPPYGPENDDGPSGLDVVTRLTTDPSGGTSKYTFPKNQVTPGEWKSYKGMKVCK